MDLTKLNEIKKAAIIGMFSDDTISESLALKGGNAIDIIYQISNRASFDIDISMKNDFNPDDLDETRKRLEHSLLRAYSDIGYKIFDFIMQERPQVIADEVSDFWGGYKIEFKILEKNQYKKLENNPDELRKYAEVVGKSQGRKIKIDLSKYEYFENNIHEIEGYKINVYSPQFVICEKLRAICQQMPEYKLIVKSMSLKPRARDFYDIYTICEKFRIRDFDPEIVKHVFQAKKVPLEFIKDIIKQKDFHRGGYNSLKDTVSDPDLKEFEYYFDFVCKLSTSLRDNINATL